MSQHKKTVMHLFFEGCWSELWRGRRVTNVWAADLKYCCCSLPSIQILFLNSLPVWTLVLSEVWIKNHVSKTKSEVILKPSVSQFWALQSCLTERLPGYTQVDPPTSDGNHSSTVSLPLRSYKRSSVNTVVMTNSGCLNEGRSLAIIFPPSAACCALLSRAVWSFRSCIFIFFLTRSLSYWTLSGFTSAGEATMPDNINMIASVNILGKVGEGTSFLLTHQVSQLITTSSESNRSHPKPSMMWC